MPHSNPAKSASIGLFSTHCSEGVPAIASNEIRFRVFLLRHREICPAAMWFKQDFYPLSLFTLRAYEQKDSVLHHRQM